MRKMVPNPLRTILEVEWKLASRYDIYRRFSGGGLIV
jgi:hypothetical protein